MQQGCNRKAAASPYQRQNSKLAFACSGCIADHRGAHLCHCLICQLQSHLVTSSCMDLLFFIWGAVSHGNGVAPHLPTTCQLRLLGTYFLQQLRSWPGWQAIQSLLFETYLPFDTVSSYLAIHCRGSDQTAASIPADVKLRSISSVSLQHVNQLLWLVLACCLAQADVF